MKNYTVKHFVAVAALMVSFAAVANEGKVKKACRFANICNNAKTFVTSSASAGKTFVTTNAGNVVQFINAHKKACAASGVIGVAVVAIAAYIKYTADNN